MTAIDQTTTIPQSEVKGRSLWKDARNRLFHNKAAVVSMVILMTITILAIIGPSLSVHDFEETYYYEDMDDLSFGPNAEKQHWFGTDSNGRDLFVRTLHGARVSLAVGIVATLVSLLIGVTYGATSGFLGGRADIIMMRFVDIIYSLPFMFFVILLMVYFERSFILIFVALGAVEWLDMARIVRGQTLSIKRKEFIEAAHAFGVSKTMIIFRHIIPNCLGPVIVYVTLLVPRVILVESFLSFLGLGIQEPYTSWGKLISDGALNIETAPWMLLFPASFLALTLFCFNFIGDGLRDALDPKDR